ncbi:MAG: pilus assembly protein PilM [Phycisphaeraceae bacterium]
MAFGFPRSRHTPIAIDFGSDQLKLLQLTAGDSPRIRAAASEMVPESARLNGEARRQFLADALPRLLKSQPFRGRKAVCSLPALQTLTQHVEIPAGPDEDLTGRVEMQLRERLNVEPTRMVVRHFRVGQIVRESGPCQQVLVLAANRDVVMGYVELARQSKLDIVGMQGEPMALLQAYQQMPGHEPGRTVALIDIGGSTTKVVIAQGDKLVFAKKIPAGGDQITREVATQRGLSFADARAARLAEAGQTRPDTPAEPAAAPAQVTGIPALDVATSTTAPPAAAPVGEDMLDCLTDELQLCVRYHQSLFPEHPLEKLVFLGGEARQVEICQRIARSLRTAAQLGNPLAAIGRGGKPGAGVDLDQPQPGWAVPLGLSLSEKSV